MTMRALQGLILVAAHEHTQDNRCVLHRIELRQPRHYGVTCRVVDVAGAPNKYTEHDDRVGLCLLQQRPRAADELARPGHCQLNGADVGGCQLFLCDPHQLIDIVRIPSSINHADLGVAGVHDWLRQLEGTQHRFVVQALLLCAEVLRVSLARLGGHGDDVLRDALQCLDLVGVVCVQAGGLDAQLSQNIKRVVVGSGVDRKAQMDVRIHGVEALVLQPVGTNLVRQPDASTLMASNVQQHTPRRGVDHIEEPVELLPAIAPLRGQYVAI
mmetsp:Transcript_130446/g.377354  ORF Transcript_130446/g.377354 Transcript_130446/m.377354 type:complete len:270 (-) Transcript_130446:10-819(-)